MNETPLITDPGVYRITEEQYHADPCPEPSLSSSVGRLLIERSPHHAWFAHPRLNPAFEADAGKSYTNVGSAVHQVALEGDWDMIEFVDEKDWRKNVAKEARDNAIAEGRTPLLEKQRAQVELMVQALEQHLPAKPAAGEPPPLYEHTYAWKEDGAWFRARIDCLQGKTIYDLKTTVIPATADGWGRRQMWEYALQAGFYRRAVEQTLGRDRPRWRFIVQEQSPPYAVAAFVFDAEAMDYCDELAQLAVERWTDAVTRDYWPTYPRGAHLAELPVWLRAKEGL